MYLKTFNLTRMLNKLNDEWKNYLWPWCLTSQLKVKSSISVIKSLDFGTLSYKWLLSYHILKKSHLKDTLHIWILT